MHSTDGTAELGDLEYGWNDPPYHQPRLEEDKSMLNFSTTHKCMAITILVLACITEWIYFLRCSPGRVRPVIVAIFNDNKNGTAFSDRYSGFLEL